MESEISYRIDRRQTLLTMAAITSAGIAGCSSNQNGMGNSGATDVVVVNAVSEPRTVSITITEADSDTPHTDKTLNLSPGETVDPVNSGKLPTNSSTYSVQVSVEGGPSKTFEWADPIVELGPLWVRIDGTRNITFLLQAG